MRNHPCNAFFVEKHLAGGNDMKRAITNAIINGFNIASILTKTPPIIYVRIG